MADFLCQASNWLYNWQTLISGILAVVAAAVSVWYLRKQIAQSEQHERERSSRRFNAVRATLPLTLSQVCNYCLEIGRCLADLHHASEEEYLNQSYAAPSLPENVPAALEKAIEATVDKSLISALSDMISNLQTLNSRINGISIDSRRRLQVTKLNVEYYIAQSATVYAIAASLFPYARRETDAPPASYSLNDVGGALFLMDLGDGLQKRIYELVERMFKPKEA